MHIFWQWYTVFLMLAGGWFSILAASNALFFRLSRRRTRWKDGPSMSILIPARNEEQRILPTLEAVVKQDYREFEVIIIDDNSTDSTWDLLSEFAEKHENVKVMKGKQLPDGWKGKPFAMTQLADAATKEILVFIDADITPAPDFLSWTADRMRRHKADSISAYARHYAKSFKEQLFFPLLYLVNFTFLPFWLIKYTKTSLMSHAIGQLMIFRREAYDGSGGFGAVYDKILEDIQMARAVKKAGYRHVFLDARKVISGYMYDSWDHVVSGLKRSIYEYFDKKLYPLIIMTFFILISMVAPGFLLIFAAIGKWAFLSNLLIGNIGLFMGWAICVWDRKQPWYVPFFYPFQFAFLLYLAWASVFDDVMGDGYSWKDRMVK